MNSQLFKDLCSALLVSSYHSAQIVLMNFFILVLFFDRKLTSDTWIAGSYHIAARVFQAIDICIMLYMYSYNVRR